MDRRDKRAREIFASIRRVLLHDWDPIGVVDIPEAQHEYDSYVGSVYRLLAGGASPAAIAAVETEQVGLTAPGEQALLPVARKLVDLDVRMEAP